MFYLISNFIPHIRPPARPTPFPPCAPPRPTPAATLLLLAALASSARPLRLTCILPSRTILPPPRAPSRAPPYRRGVFRRCSLARGCLARGEYDRGQRLRRGFLLVCRPPIRLAANPRPSGVRIGRLHRMFGHAVKAGSVEGPGQLCHKFKYSPRGRGGGSGERFRQLGG